MPYIPIVSVLLIVSVFVYLVWFKPVRKTKKWIVIGLLFSTIAAFIFAYYGFPKETKSEYAYVSLELYFVDRGENRYDDSPRVQQVFFLFRKSHTRVLILCDRIYHPEDINTLLFLYSPDLHSFNMDSLEKKSIRIFAIPDVGYNPKKLLFQPQGDLEREFQASQIPYEVRSEDMKRCYLDLSSVEDKIMENNFWIRFDTEALEFRKQTYIHTRFSGSERVNSISLWTDEKYDMILSFPQGRPFPDHVNFEVYESSPECTIKVRKIERLNEAWFVAIFAILLSMISFYFGLSEKSNQLEGTINDSNKLSHRIWIIYSFPILSAVFSFIISSKCGFFASDDNARYMLSALAQSEAAVIAIFVTVTLIGIQLGATYSPRVAHILSKSSEFKVLVFSYVFAVLYSLWVLGTLKTNYEIHVRISFGVGVFCFAFLLLHSVEMFNVIEPSRYIGGLSCRINKTNILSGREVFLPIIDIMRVSIIKHDERTVELGLKMIGDRIRYMFEKEEFDEREEREISIEIYDNLVKFGRFAMKQKDDNSAWAVIENVERIGIKVIEEKLEWAAMKAAASLSILGNTAIRNNFADLAEQAVIRLFGLGETAIDHEIKNAVSIVRFLNVIRRNAFKYELKEIAYDAEMSLGQLRELAVKKENKNLVSYFDRIQKEYSEEQSGF